MLLLSKFQNKQFSLPKEFTYEFVTENRYEMPKIKFKNNHYELMCNNGFIKIYTIFGRLY